MRNSSSKEVIDRLIERLMYQWVRIHLNSLLTNESIEIESNKSWLISEDEDIWATCVCLYRQIIRFVRCLVWTLTANWRSWWSLTDPAGTCQRKVQKAANRIDRPCPADKLKDICKALKSATDKTCSAHWEYNKQTNDYIYRWNRKGFSVWCVYLHWFELNAQREREKGKESECWLHHQ